MDTFDLRQWSGFIAAGGNPDVPAIIDQIAIDSRRIYSSTSLFVALEGKVQDGHRFIAQAHKNGARYALVKKEWCSSEPLENLIVLRVDDPLRALQSIAGAYRNQLPCKIIAIAGSYGKTMVKDLLEAMLSTQYSVTASPESFNSQIGVALSLLTLSKAHEYALIEAAFSQKNEMGILSDIIKSNFSIITHNGKKHLATLGDLNTSAAEMVKILQSPPTKEWAILPKDEYILSNIVHVQGPGICDALTQAEACATYEPLLLHTRMTIKSCEHVPNIGEFPSNYYFWTDQRADMPHARFISDERDAKMTYRVDFPDGQLHYGQITSGFYYFLDLINITCKAAWLLGISSDNISATLRAYTPEPIRTEIWKSPIGTTFINDTYCSDPQSVDNALKYLRQGSSANRKVFVFGGMRGRQSHHSDYKRIGQAISRANVDLLLLYGPHQFQPLIDEVKSQSPHSEISYCATYKDSLNLMRARIKHDDTILIKGDQKHSIDLLTETFNDSICSNQCIINLAAIADNLASIRKMLPVKTRIMVMVKALAYGTDEVRMAKFLENCAIDILGVSYVDEGVTLKRAGVTQSIFVINAAVYEAAKVVKWELEIGVSDKALIEAVAIEASRQNKKIKVHLHIDTGMGRFGCRPEEAIDLAKLIADCPHLEFEGAMTHFACADDPTQDAFTRSQADCLEKIILELEAKGMAPRWSHASNSSGAIRFNFPQFNMVRIGLAVYGLYASPTTKDALELRLALSLISRIVGINTCKMGETISYGRRYSVQREKQRIAVLPIGYFDGLHRNYSGKGSVIIRGQKAPMVGNICMDFMMVDVTDIPHASPGDSVLIFGEDEYGHYLSPEELASRGDSIIHELITCLGPRIQRIFVHEEARRVH